MSAIIARIALRYLSGALVAAGLLDEDIAQMLQVDPDVLTAVGLAIGAATEFAYGLARKYGWAK
jgi:preprotein translocase subunit Sec61beta